MSLYQSMSVNEREMYHEIVEGKKKRTFVSKNW